ncbi:MAG: hypothetical protein A2428_03710 [Bdellovibrionales bacterium RIFOXYC1_FULL_54_43]|nr:MAG: hypothetical protein A2428_03710 [Bdellovibrionales bacterium RIFOXYC1_FULL_54_43]OFZ83818.1 MAG: hypothetical protein A2603_11135 [Bdellovibrionales bacterium RIFOXYD1_FULL_55_31]
MKRNSTGYFGVERFRDRFRARYERFGAKRTILESPSAEACALAWDDFQLRKRGIRSLPNLNFPDRFQEQIRELRMKEAEHQAREASIRENARRTEPLTETERAEVAKLSSTGTLADVISKKLAIHIDVVLEELQRQRAGREANERLLAECEEADFDGDEQVERVLERYGARRPA